MVSCPFAEELHGDRKDDYPSFGINIYSGDFHCFACGVRGTNIRTLAYKMKVMLPDDIMQKSLLISPKLKDSRISTKIDCSEHIKILSKGAERAYKILGKRGISLEAIKRFKVGYNQEGSITFPCILSDGKLAGWIERNDLWDGRYGYQPKGVNRKWLLFGLDRKIKRAFLTESMTDMLKLVTFHVEAVSTCGNMVFLEQARLLVENCEELILVPQNDKAAENWLKDCNKYFRNKIRTYRITLPDRFKDLGESKFTKELWKKTYNNTLEFLY